MKKRNAYFADEDFFTSLVTIPLLESLGYHVTIFRNAESLMSKLKAEPYPDLVIIDERLPGMNGFEVTRAIRSAAEGKGLQLIVCSSNGKFKAQIEEAGGKYAAKIGKPSLEDVVKQCGEKFPHSQT
jgi:twitching motility two-component system response regulator PilH